MQIKAPDFTEREAPYPDNGMSVGCGTVRSDHARPARGRECNVSERQRPAAFARSSGRKECRVHFFAKQGDERYQSRQNRMGRTQHKHLQPRLAAGLAALATFTGLLWAGVVIRVVISRGGSETPVAGRPTSSPRRQGSADGSLGTRPAMPALSLPKDPPALSSPAGLFPGDLPSRAR